MRYEPLLFPGLHVHCSRSKELRSLLLFDLFCHLLEGKKEKNCYIFFTSVHSIFSHGMYTFKSFAIDHVQKSI